MPPCYTCGQQVAFNKNILSKTGKQIPLWPDQKDAHAHDENGQPIRKALPLQTNPYQQQQQQPTTQQFYQEQQQPTSTTTSTQGGSSLDTKRILNAVSELTKEIRELKQIVDSRTIIDTNKYEGKSDQIFGIIAPFLNTQGVVAADLLKEKEKPEIRGWNSTTTEEFPVEQTLKEDEDDEGARQ